MLPLPAKSFTLENNNWYNQALLSLETILVNDEPWFSATSSSSFDGWREPSPPAKVREPQGGPTTQSPSEKTNKKIKRKRKRKEEKTHHRELHSTSITAQKRLSTRKERK
jgi:hypothetical protein